MNILVIGLGVIGTTYGTVFKKAGHNVEHYLREGSKRKGIKTLQVNLLDGRKSQKGMAYRKRYDVEICSKRDYDLIIISVAQGRIDDVMQLLNREKINGTILLCCNLWHDKPCLDKVMRGYNYILGFPVAGGRIDYKEEEDGTEGKLDCCLFDHFMLETEYKANIPNYEAICSLFESCNIKLEKPYDMLEWIWIHMAINAAVISVIAKNGDIKDSRRSAQKLMDSTKLLSVAVKAICETTRIVATRGIDMKHYRNELWMYKIPSYVSAVFMKRMFANNTLTRRIMELHGNIDDLLYICNSVYKQGKQNNISAPIFYLCIESICHPA